MYYAIYHNQEKQVLTYRIFTALLFISILLITRPTIVSADLRSDTAEQYRINGYEEQQKGNFDQAINWYTKSLSLVPDNPVIFNDMGVLYEQLGIDDRAEQYYLRAIRVDENYLPPYLNLAYFYKKQGNTAEEIEYFKERYERADTMDRWAKLAREEAFQIDPRMQQKVIDEQVLDLTTQLVEEARKEFYMQVVRSNNHFKKGQEFLDQKAYDDAIAEFDRALQLTPDNPKIIKAKEEVLSAKVKDEITNHSTEALKMLDAGQAESAKEEYRKILTIFQNNSIQESE